jgi:aquaporin Z
LNPAVTIGLTAAGRFEKSKVLPYIFAQSVGAILGAGILYIIATGKAGAEIGGFATNGYAAGSPGNFNMIACFVTEFVFTFAFVKIILGATSKDAPAGFAPIAIGLGLTLVHLVTIPVTNTSVNPARSLGPAIFVGGMAIQQVWLFWVAPILGGFIAGITDKKFSK